jgi:hypothetical protein
MDMPADQYELYAEFGITSEKAQVLELEAGNVALGFLTMFVDKATITPELTEMFRAVNNDIDRKTFGSLLKQIKKLMILEDSISAVVDEALESRNYLTHHFFRSHNFALYSENGRKIMMAELKEIQGKLDLAHRTLSAMSELMFQMSGREMDKGLIEQFVARGKKIGI